MSDHSGENWPGYLHRVRYSEVDPQFIVFNSRYLEFIDAAMTEYYREIGFSPEVIVTTGYDPVVKKVVIEYHDSARLDDIIRIHVTCSRLGSSSLDLSFRILREEDQQLLVSATLTYVNIDQQSRRPVPVPEIIRTAVSQ
jgi:acyl-CoA thioester hydrolase